jgi:hypothetical protein
VYDKYYITAFILSFEFKFWYIQYAVVNGVADIGLEPMIFASDFKSKQINDERNLNETCFTSE